MQIGPIPDTLIFGWDKSDLHFLCNKNVAWAALPVSIFVTVTIVVAFCVWAQVNLQRLWSAWKNARKHKGLPSQYGMQIAPIPDTLIFALSQSDLGVGVSPVNWIVTVTIVVAFCVWAQVNLQRLRKR
jgi:hypothetical protein